MGPLQVLRRAFPPLTRAGIYLTAARDGTRVAWCLTNPKIGECEVAIELHAHRLHRLHRRAVARAVILIGDNGFAHPTLPSGLGLHLIHTGRRDEIPVGPFLIRQWAKSVDSTLKGQFNLKRHNAGTTGASMPSLSGDCLP